MKAFTQKILALGPFGLFVIALLDSAGIPIPAVVDVALVALALQGPWVAVLAAAGAITGSLLGNMILFEIAKRGGEQYLARQTEGTRGRKMQAWFQRYGLTTVLVPAVLPVPLPLKIFVICCGALGVKRTQFLSVIASARVIRYAGLALLAFKLGSEAPDFLKKWAWVLIPVVVAVYVGVLVWVRRVESEP